MPTDKEPDLEAQEAAEPQTQDEVSEPTPAPPYEVGFGKPPTHTRFKPGQSGNAKGRPKGHKNFRTDLLETLEERIVIRKGGRSKKVTQQRALLMKLFTDALQGNARASALAISTIARFLDPGAQELEVR